MHRFGRKRKPLRLKNKLANKTLVMSPASALSSSSRRLTASNDSCAIEPAFRRDCCVMEKKKQLLSSHASSLFSFPAASFPSACDQNASFAAREKESVDGRSGAVGHDSVS